MLWAISVADSCVLLVDDQAQVRHSNAAADALVARLHPGEDHATAALLLQCVPPHAWEEAAECGRWAGETVARPGNLVLEIKLFSGLKDGARRGLVLMDDVTARAGRESELLRRHEELRRTYSRLAGAQEQLLQSEKMASIGQLAAGVAHEINNPIGYVHSNLGTLQEYVGSLFSMLEAYARTLQYDDPAASRESLQAMRERLDVDFIAVDLPQLLSESREGIERVTKIVQDLKEFSHVGREEAMRPSDLRRGLESTLNIVWNDLKYKVRVEKHYGELPLVECHLSEINQVFMNLLINAGQAIAERGTIMLATGTDEDEVWISVADSGCGIAEAELARIFDPFFTTKPIGSGTGLGLAIAYRIVAKHNGRIEVSSRPGAGSTFRVVLPVTQPVAAEGGPSH